MVIAVFGCRVVVRVGLGIVNRKWVILGLVVNPFMVQFGVDLGGGRRRTS